MNEWTLQYALLKLFKSGTLPGAVFGFSVYVTNTVWVFQYTMILIHTNTT